MKKFGDRLKELRLNKGLTIKELANEVELTDVALLLCEKGHCAINIKQLIKLAKYFNVALDYLIGLSDLNI